MDDVVLARALHVLAVVHWIGGLGFVTFVVLPLARGAGSAKQFEAVERRFAAQVRISVPLAGATGLWMVWRLDLWDRLLDLRAWWMPAMLGLWTAFMLMLFVIEPLLHGRFTQAMHAAPARLLGLTARVHLALAVLAGVTILGVVAGVHGG